MPDKGNATVVLDIAEYVDKIKNVLEDPVYKKVSNNPFKKLEKEVSLALRASNIPKELHSRTPQHCVKNAENFIMNIEGIQLDQMIS